MLPSYPNTNSAQSACCATESAPEQRVDNRKPSNIKKNCLPLSHGDQTHSYVPYVSGLQGCGGCWCWLCIATTLAFFALRCSTRVATLHLHGPLNLPSTLSWRHPTGQRCRRHPGSGQKGTGFVSLGQRGDGRTYTPKCLSLSWVSPVLG